MMNFNPRSREGSDIEDARNAVDVAEISIHAPARGATTAAAPTSASPFYFNPRSREGSDFKDALIFPSLRISIHAPARGATPLHVDQCLLQQISIHAPARGATATISFWYSLGFNFNPRSREGSDVYPAGFLVSTTLFQSTLPRGERPRKQISCCSSNRFQSTLPRGERR